MKPLFSAAVLTLLALGAPHHAAAESTPLAKRQAIMLDGSWQVAEGSLAAPPTNFDHTAPVPGLIDQALPAFTQVGEKDQPREAFWYRTTFALPGSVPDVAVLKINRAIYGVRVLLNGAEVGHAVTGFSGCECVVTKNLKGAGAVNELLICVGAYPSAIPEAYPDGFDPEKKRYISGVFDSVSLVLSGFPYLDNIQVAPQIDKGSARVVVEIAHGQADGTPLHAILRNVKTGEAVVEQDVVSPKAAADGSAKADFTMTIPGVHLWTPEDPFLYRLELTSKGDSNATRFGMREFHFDPVTHVPTLNGKPYYLRGSNVTFFRFLEDSQRGSLPWSADWVRKLHELFKTMGWNGLRYCIGAPPQFWYDIADETGVLIDDEFPIWYNEGSPKGKKNVATPLKVDAIAEEYALGMRERWNHPSVIIWDGQNESRRLTVTGDAIQKVRGLDLSRRPWDNGWGARQDPGDMQEVHLYLYQSFAKRPFHLARLQGRDGNPVISLAKTTDDPNPPQTNVILNEYDWLWLNRDGSPTKLSKEIWESGQLDFPSATIEERRYAYARIMAALTEYWRSYRKIAGVFEFTALGYSRPDGQTSDHFVDVANLKIEPNYLHFVGDAFSPIGVMVDYWLPTFSPGQFAAPVCLINDLATAWEGSVTLTLRRDGKVVCSAKGISSVPSGGRAAVTLSLQIPPEPGKYQLVGSISDANGKVIESLRDVMVGPEPAASVK